VNTEDGPNAHIYMYGIVYFIHIHEQMHIHRTRVYINRTKCAYTFSRYRVAKTHTMPFLYKSFALKEPYNEWLFCEK